jgi:hypothetical protein
MSIIVVVGQADLLGFSLVIQVFVHPECPYLSPWAGWQRSFSTSRGQEWRILAIDPNIDDELVERGFTGVFTVEPA